MWLPSARHRQLPDTGSKVAGLPFCRLQGKLLQEKPRKSRAGEGVAGGGGGHRWLGPGELALSLMSPVPLGDFFSEWQLLNDDCGTGVLREETRTADCTPT